ncbi:MAG: ATP-binding cassette domain-containing protein [Coprobacter sp.]|nr:ATP-binding cassette domain-containing protein [Coprobacter sp.]
MYYLEATGIIKQYEHHLALDGVTVQVPENSVYGLLGPNGAGKSSLIRIINQITLPDSGTVCIRNKRITPQDIARIGYLPEERGLYPKMKVGEQIVYLARLKGMSKNDARQEMLRWLEKLGIGEWETKKTEQLSKGMQQKVQFIATVIHRPELLIFDEPFSGFDPVNANVLKQEIRELRETGATFILSTHNMTSVEELCDEISLIHRAKVVLSGRVDEIKERYKKNIFRIRTETALPEPGPSGEYRIIESWENGRFTESIIRKNDAVDTPTLISHLARSARLSAFEEILPGMEEIFIDAVKPH